METIRVHDDLPLSVYNSEKKELIGIFASMILVRKYFYPLGQRKESSKIRQSLMSRSRVYCEFLNISIAVRHANDNQKKVLGDKPYIIMDGYPPPTSRISMDGQKLSRESMYIKQVKEHHNKNPKKK